MSTLSVANLSDLAGGTNINIGGGTPEKLVLMTAQATTSGTAIDFTGIPSWVKRITVMISSVSTTGTSPIQVQIGSGSISTSGYAGGTTMLGLTGVNTNNYTSGLVLSIANGDVALASRHGIATFTLLSSNLWVGNGQIQSSYTTYGCTGNCSITLSGTLDRIRLTTVNGTDTFDAGSVNVLYEG